MMLPTQLIIEKRFRLRYFTDVLPCDSCDNAYFNSQSERKILDTLLTQLKHNQP